MRSEIDASRPDAVGKRLASGAESAPRPIDNQLIFKRSFFARRFSPFSRGPICLRIARSRGGEYVSPAGQFCVYDFIYAGARKASGERAFIMRLVLFIYAKKFIESYGNGLFKRRDGGCGGYERLADITLIECTVQC